MGLLSSVVILGHPVVFVLAVTIVGHSVHCCCHCFFLLTDVVGGGGGVVVGGCGGCGGLLPFLFFVGCLFFFVVFS